MVAPLPLKMAVLILCSWLWTVSNTQAVQTPEFIRKFRSMTRLLDPVRSSLVKAHALAVYSPFSHPINMPLYSGNVAVGIKTTTFALVLKKPGSTWNNYRPISNLPLLAKIRQCAVAS